MRIPIPENTIESLIDKSHESKKVSPRPHMGASLLGHPCDRWLWLNFRWAVIQKHQGRMLRLFRRGHSEEEVAIADLNAAGVLVSNFQNPGDRGFLLDRLKPPSDVTLSFKETDGKYQLNVDFGFHVSGSVDGVILSGVLEATKKFHILEIKTHNEDSFKKLEKEKVKKAKPEHWVQMQVYMYGTGIDRALYYAVCKNDDRIYTERVKLDVEMAKIAVERGQRLAYWDSAMIPPPISDDPSWYRCKWCPAYEFCHQTKTTTEKNCRTCEHSKPEPDNTWSCYEHPSEPIPFEFQQVGCDKHVVHRDLVDLRHADTSFKFGKNK